MLRHINAYEIMFLVGMAFVAGTIGAAEMGGISNLRLVLQLAAGLYITVRNGAKAAQLFCRRAERREEE